MPNKFDTNQWVRNWSDKKEMTPLPERSKPKKEKKKRFIDYMAEVATMARDARIGNLGAQMVRDLYNEGKTEEAQKLANDFLKANVAGIVAGVAAPVVAAEAPVATETAKAVGKNLLQGAFDYTLADGAVRAVTGKDIMTNVNNGVKQVFGDNKYTDFATQYVTPMAPIPVFGTGNFTKNVMTAGKNAVQIAKQYPELLYQIDKAALTALDKTGAGKWLMNKDYKWLDRDIPFYNTIFNYRLPKAIRDKVHRDSHMYHVDQLRRLGDIGYIIPDDWTSYVSPTIREQLYNSAGLNNGTARKAAAGARPYENEIVFYIEGLGRKDDIIGSLYHEKKHLIQLSPFEVPIDSQLKLIPTSNDFIEIIQRPSKEIGDGVYSEVNEGLIPAASRLHKTYKDEWHEQLPEFDAEIAAFRKDDLRPYHMMDDLSKARIKRLASERFGISEDDADFIATQLSINGYKRGGKINQAE